MHQAQTTPSNTSAVDPSSISHAQYHHGPSSLQGPPSLPSANTEPSSSNQGRSSNRNQLSNDNAGNTRADTSKNTNTSKVYSNGTEATINQNNEEELIRNAVRDQPETASTFLDNFVGPSFLNEANREVELGIHALAVDERETNFSETNLPELPASSQLDSSASASATQRGGGANTGGRNISPDEITLLGDLFGSQPGDFLPGKQLLGLDAADEGADYDSDDGPPLSGASRRRIRLEENNEGQKERDEMSIESQGQRENDHTSGHSGKRASREMDNVQAPGAVREQQERQSTPDKKRPRTLQKGGAPSRRQPTKIYPAMNRTAAMNQQAMMGPVYLTNSRYMQGARNGGMMVSTMIPIPVSPLGPGGPALMPIANAYGPSTAVDNRGYQSRQTESVSSRDSMSGDASSASGRGSPQLTSVQKKAKLKGHTSLNTLHLQDGSQEEEANRNAQGGEQAAKPKPKTPKKRLQWSDKLHERFVKAVRAVGGVEKAVPRQILKHMNVEGLTSEHVKSHLQKYRNTQKEQKQANNFDISALTGGKPRMPGHEELLAAPLSSVLGVPLASPAELEVRGVGDRLDLQRRAIVNLETRSEGTIGSRGSSREGRSSELNARDGAGYREQNARATIGMFGIGPRNRSGVEMTIDRSEMRRKQVQQVEKQLDLQEHILKQQMTLQIIVNRMVQLQRQLQDKVVAQTKTALSNEDLAKETGAIANEFNLVQRQLERQQEYLKRQMAEQEKLRQDLVRDAEAIGPGVAGIESDNARRNNVGERQYVNSASNENNDEMEVAGRNVQKSQRQ